MISLGIEEDQEAYEYELGLSQDGLAFDCARSKETSNKPTKSAYKGIQSWYPYIYDL